jgi:hypothetical protein
LDWNQSFKCRGWASCDPGAALGYAGSAAIERRGLNGEPWAVVELVLRPAGREDNRGCAAGGTERGAVGAGNRGAVARNVGEVSAVQDLPSPFPAVGSQRQAGRGAASAGRASARAGKLNLEEAFADAAFASFKKEACRRPHPSRQGTEIIAVASGNSLPLAVSVDSASPAECQLVEYVLAEIFLDQVPSDRSATRCAIRTRSRAGSSRNTASEGSRLTGATGAEVRMAASGAATAGAGKWRGFSLGCPSSTDDPVKRHGPYFE